MHLHPLDPKRAVYLVQYAMPMLVLNIERQVCICGAVDAASLARYVSTFLVPCMQSRTNLPSGASSDLCEAVEISFSYVMFSPQGRS
jgi:hypothetical protein